MAANASDFDGWPDVLVRLAGARPVGGTQPFDDFLAEMAADAEAPVVRATARFFMATAVAERVNRPSCACAACSPRSHRYPRRNMYTKINGNAIYYHLLFEVCHPV